MPRTVAPACDPRQNAHAFNQPLSWDTSGVTHMGDMFAVRCSPRPVPPKLYWSHLSLLHVACTHTTVARRPPASQPAPLARTGVCPCLQSLAERASLQPALQLGHLGRH